MVQNLWRSHRAADEARLNRLELLAYRHLLNMRHRAKKNQPEEQGRLWRPFDKLPMMLNPERGEQSKHAGSLMLSHCMG
ncbi:hypothetical protein [Yersinia intermedia]|uniref:hypothetical protein n=1 Tax=Yersinia intermedia TaxID=631 RepID=UPI00163EEA23|nr:hypothetical protein [Yersinia intermedia]